jgi:hypothetical protein
MTTIYPDGAFKALDPFFNVIQQGLAGFVDGERFFDTIADDDIGISLYCAGLAATH